MLNRQIIAQLRSSLSRKRSLVDIKKQEITNITDLLFKIPPDLTKAKVHAEAQKARLYNDKANLINCRCFWCDRVVPEYTELIPLCGPPSKLIQYGDGFPLLFQFMKYVTYLFIALFIIQGIYFFIVIVILYFSKSDMSDFSIAKVLSVDIIVQEDGTSHKQLIIVYEVLAMLCNFALIILASFFWVQQIKYKNQLDENAKTDADFAVIFQNLPLDLNKDGLHKLINKAGVKDDSIVYTCKWYEFSHILNLKKKQFYWLHKLKYLEAFRRRHAHKLNTEELSNLYPKRSLLNWPPYKQFPTEDMIRQELKEVENELVWEENKEVNFCGTTIVVLRREKDAEDVISHYKKRVKWLRLCTSKEIYAKRPTEPDDIIWENVPFNKIKRKLIVISIYIGCIFLLIPTYFFVIFVRDLKGHNGLLKSNNQIITFGFQLIVTAILFLVNILIEIYIFVSTVFEKQKTKTATELSIIVKLSLLTFLNTCLIPLLSARSRSSWFEKDGLVQEVSVIVIIMNLSEIGRMIFHPQFLLHLALKVLLQCKKKHKLTITQKQANWIFENEEVKMGKTMSCILIFWLTILFYCPIIPGLTIFGIFGSILMYWVMKYLILRRMSIKMSMSSMLLMRATQVIKFGVLFNAIMGFIFFNILLNRISIPCLLSLIAAGFFFILPVKKYLIKWFIKEVNREDGTTYFNYFKK